MELANQVIAIESIVSYDETNEPHNRLRRIFLKGGDALYRYILVRVGGDSHLADDLLQQTCHEAARGRRLPDDDNECEAWLRGIARNLLRRHWRQRKRTQGQVPLENAVLAGQLVADMESHPLPADGMIRDEAAGQLMLAVTSLPAEEQRLIFAFYFQGRSQADIAQETAQSAKSVETRLYRVRHRLRAILRNIERT